MGNVQRNVLNQYSNIDWITPVVGLVTEDFVFRPNPDRFFHSEELKLGAILLSVPSHSDTNLVKVSVIRPYDDWGRKLSEDELRTAARCSTPQEFCDYVVSLLADKPDEHNREFSPTFTEAQGSVMFECPYVVRRMRGNRTEMLSALLACVVPESVSLNSPASRNGRPIEYDAWFAQTLRLNLCQSDVDAIRNRKFNKSYYGIIKGDAVNLPEQIDAISLFNDVCNVIDAIGSQICGVHSDVEGEFSVDYVEMPGVNIKAVIALILKKNLGWLPGGADILASTKVTGEMLDISLMESLRSPLHLHEDVILRRVTVKWPDGVATPIKIKDMTASIAEHLAQKLPLDKYMMLHKCLITAETVELGQGDHEATALISDIRKTLFPEGVVCP
jgi:hypothetical protein